MGRDAILVGRVAQATLGVGWAGVETRRRVRAVPGRVMRVLPGVPLIAPLARAP